MTKINKLGKSTFVIAILSFLLVALLAFGGTYAYFSANATATTGKITMGHLKIGTDGAKFDSSVISTSLKAVPNQTIISSTNGGVSCAVDSNIKYFARAKVEYSVEIKDTTISHTSCSCADKDIKLVAITLPSTTDWAFQTTAAADGQGYYYNTKAQAADTNSVALKIDAKVSAQAGQVASTHFMDAEITVTVTFELIQADYIMGDGSAEAGAAATVSELEAAWIAATKAIAAGN